MTKKMSEYLLDFQARGAVRIRAENEDAARKILKEELQAASTTFHGDNDTLTGETSVLPESIVCGQVDGVDVDGRVATSEEVKVALAAIPGLHFNQCVEFFSERQTPLEKAYVEAAQCCRLEAAEIDSDAIVSLTDDGACVMGWSFVRENELPKEFQTEEDE